MNFQKQTLYGLHAVESFLRKHPTRVLTLFIAKNREDKRIEKIVKFAKDNQIAIEFVNAEKLDKLTQEGVHQGAALLAKIPEYQECDLETLLTELPPKPLLLVLDSIQDPHNLGACLRTAEAAGVALVMIPKDKSASLTPLVRKIACGAAEMVPVVQVTNLSRALQIAKQQGIWFVGLTAAQEAQSIYKTELTGAIGLVLGSEGKGLRQLTIKQCDHLAYIPMQGNIESLNVSVATGIGLFEALRQRL